MDTLGKCRESQRQNRHDEALTIAKACWQEFICLPHDEQENQMSQAIECLALMSESLWRTGERQEAVNTAVSLYSLNPADCELACRVGLFMRKAKLPEFAAVFYTRALALVPTNVRVKMTLRALQTDIQLLANSPAMQNSLVLPDLPPLSASFSPITTAWVDEDVSSMSSSLANVELFTVPPSRNDSTHAQPAPPSHGAFNVVLSSATAQPASSVEISKCHGEISSLCRVHSGSQTETLVSCEGAKLEMQSEARQQNKLQTTAIRRATLVTAALCFTLLLHNLLEGTNRPVFRFFGIPLSTFTSLLALTAVIY